MRVAVFAMLFATAAAAAEGPRLTVQAVRATTPPVIDADLSDEVWQRAPEITGFIQHDPDDGKPATQKTVVKVAYDDNAIYIAAKMDDTKPVTTQLSRRDNNVESDWFRIYIDAQHDRLTGAEFWVNPSNVQLDGTLYNDIYDDWSWDAVWVSAAKIVPGGWVAEVRIPYSQLRFPEKPVQVWGINFNRRISKNKENDWLVNVPKSDSALVSRFADLTGIEGIRPERALELMPYAVGRSDLANHINTGDPFTRPADYKVDGGLDVKYGLSSSLTLTGTVNPDFGQVEVDPAVLNLSQFETFFPEKRPFFTEGLSIFEFGSGPANSRWNFNLFPPKMFYSRRIGRAPQGTGNVAADFVEAPTSTTILGAGKLTGKIGNGWSIGVLDAYTAAEHAHFALGGVDDMTTVEPATNYLVARSTKEYGNSRIGVLVTDVQRRNPEELSYLRSGALGVGVDGYTLFHKKDWLFEWQASETDVRGTADAIATTQSGPAHEYDRPDNDYVRFDPTRTSLNGWGGRAMLGKQTGHWRPNVQVAAYSPGFETNDVGFMPRADAIATHATIYYINQDTTARTRDREIWVSKYQNWNFGHDLLANGLFGNWYVQVLNYWYGFGNFGHAGPTLDDRKTRGGPVAGRPANSDFGAGLGSDNRKKVYFEFSSNNNWDEAGGYDHSVYLTMKYRPTTNLTLGIGPSYEWTHTFAQYVDTIPDPSYTQMYGNHYVFGRLEQRVVELDTRVDWTLSSRLSLQVFLQPFVATGDYHDFRELTRPRSLDYAPYAYNGSNPDFNFRSLRGSAVMRWEFRPGSALYVVWNENRSDTETIGDFRFRRDFGSLRSAASRDVFLVKLSYWLPI